MQKCHFEKQTAVVQRKINILPKKEENRYRQIAI
jgi:hypothetical protein